MHPSYHAGFTERILHPICATKPRTAASHHNGYWPGILEQHRTACDFTLGSKLQVWSGEVAERQGKHRKQIWRAWQRHYETCSRVQWRRARETDGLFRARDGCFVHGAYLAVHLKIRCRLHPLQIVPAKRLMGGK